MGVMWEESGRNIGVVIPFFRFKLLKNVNFEGFYEFVRRKYSTVDADILRSLSVFKSDGFRKSVRFEQIRADDNFPFSIKQKRKNLTEIGIQCCQV